MKKWILYCLPILGPALIGCVTPAPKTPDLGGPRLEETLAAAYLSKGEQLEEQGDLVSALEQYKLALTVDPLHPEAEKGRARLQKAIPMAAEAHYKRGIALNREGRYKQARHQFLMALALRPDYPEALKRVNAHKLPPLKVHVEHTVKPGESLSKLAQIYYEDYRKFPIIARYNNLTDATQLRVGQKIMIPGMQAAESGEGEATATAEDESGTEEPIDQVAIYRDHGLSLFMDKQFEEAIIEFEKVLKTHPDDKLALEFSYRAHYELALTLFEKKDYLSARDQFRSCLQYKKECQKCHAYIQKSEDTYKEIHYRKGIQSFQKEELHQAIEEWELVCALDPDYKKTGDLIKKAKVILKKIEEIKRNQQE
ncbi:MAG: tetratricopeptide repeat protein [Desulfobacteraceae bacterium]